MTDNLTRPLSIAMPVPRSWPWTGGVETHIKNLAATLTEMGHTVNVFAPTQQVLPDGKPAPEYMVERGVIYRFFPLPIDTTWAVPPRKLVTEMVRLSEQFDVVHTHALHKPLAVLIAETMRNNTVPLVVTPHYHGTGHTPVATVAHVGYRPVAKHALSRADHVIAVSPSERNLLVRHFPNIATRTTVIPNGISAPDLNATPAQHPGKVVLAVGRLEEYKGVQDAITALTLLPKDVHLVVIGDGPARQRLELLTTSLGLTSRVKFLGKISDSELASWWARADAYVTLSKHEAFGLTLGEALSYGVPSVASEIPAHRYVLDLAENGVASTGMVHFVPVSLPQQTATSLTLAITHGRARALPLPNWADVAETTEALYLGLIKKNTGKK